MFTISDSKKEKIENYANEAMKAIGKLTMCLGSCDEDDDDFGMREFDPEWDDMNMRYGAGYPGGGVYSGGYSGHGGMGMRRGVRGTGPYSRFR